LTITTGSLVARSLSVNALPANKRIPTDAKYPSLTNRM
jgi:hypothetical protein